MRTRRWSCLQAFGAGLLAVAGLTASVQAQDAENFGLAGPAPVQPKEAALPLSARLGVQLDRGAGLIVLDRVNNDMLVDDDAAHPQAGKVMRYGVGRDVAWNPLAGAWYPVPVQADGQSGFLWVCDIASPQAYGMRLHLADMNLPKGAVMDIYAPNRPGQIAGPYQDQGLLGSGEMWTASIFDEISRVEVFYPGDAFPADLGFRIDSAQHNYRDLAQLRGAIEEGTCYHDVSCYPAWNNVSHASAGIGFISSGASLYCSGTMLNALNGDLTPYWLTANHCLQNNTQAQTSEIFWFYQTPSCNGTVPALSGVPRSQVCTLLSTNAASDYTLLMIEGTIPGGTFWAGWNTGVNDGAGVTCIHHPGGGFKRISFGNKSSAATCGPNHITSNWIDASVTEPGSSGSGLFRNDSQQLIGQLHCGPSSCTAAPAQRYDGYGNFGVTYPNIQGLLNAGSDDALEPNDSCGAARFLGGIGSTNNSGLIVKSNSQDWYRFTVPGTGGTFSASIGFTGAFGDVDMQLVDGCGGTIVATSSGVGNTEAISYTNTGATRDFYLHIYLFSDVRNTYNMSTVVAPATTNNACANAIAVGPGTYLGTTIGMTNDGSASCGSSTTSPDAWYSFTAGADGTLTVDTCGSAFDTVLSVHSGCSGTTANQLVCDDDSGNCGSLPHRQSSLSVGVLSGRTYLIRVCGFNGVTGNFSLNVAFASTPATDACGSAALINPGVYGGNTAGATNDGSPGCAFVATSPDVWYAFAAPGGGTLTVDSCGSSYDTVLSIHSGCPGDGTNSIACNDDFCDLQSRVSAPVVGGSTYHVRVGGFGGATGAYNIHVVFVPTLAADDCGSAVTVPTGTYVGSTGVATNDGVGAGACGAAQTAPDLWYGFIAPATGTLTVDSCGSNYDTVLTIHDGCPGTASNELGCNDDFCGLQSNASATVQSGQRYLIRVAGFGGAAGDYVIHVSFAPAVATDTCSDAIAIGPGTYSGSTTEATIDGQANCNLNNSADVWYAFDAPASGTLDIDLCGSNYDTLLSVHTGCPGNNANLIACNDDSGGLAPCAGSLLSHVITHVDGGQHYLIRVSGFSTSTGTFTLHLAFTQTPAAEACGDAVQVGPGTYTGSTLTASNDGSADCGLSTTSPDVWYLFSDPRRGNLTVDSCGSGYDTVLSLHNGCPGNLGNQITCNDDFCGFQSQVAAGLAAGQTVAIRVSGFNAGAGNYTLHIAFVPTTCVIDFNNDGDINADDLGDFITCYFSVPPCPGADFNGTDGVNADDLGDFITAYFAGCP